MKLNKFKSEPIMFNELWKDRLFIGFIEIGGQLEAMLFFKHEYNAAMPVYTYGPTTQSVGISFGFNDQDLVIPVEAELYHNEQFVCSTDGRDNPDRELDT